MMRVAILWDRDGETRAALEAAGFDCVGFEPRKALYEKSLHSGSGRCCNMRPRDAHLDSFDAVWVNDDFDISWLTFRPTWVHGNELPP